LGGTVLKTNVDKEQTKLIQSALAGELQKQEKQLGGEVVG
jgi:hypothetical protein